MSHAPKLTTGGAFSSPESDTRTSGTGQAGSGNRAKSLPLGNPLMHARRIRSARVLGEVLASEKEVVRACMLGVSRTLVARWLDLSAVDRNPAPLAVLWALDDETFDRFVDAVRTDREGQRGR